MANNLMTKEEVIAMQREVLKRRGRSYRVVIPYEVIEYVKGLKHSNIWKGKFILLYMGVYLAYRESYYTYRLRAMNTYTIMQLMNLNPENRELSSEFSKKGYLAKEKIITHVNDLPYMYQFTKQPNGKAEIEYMTAKKNLEKEDWHLMFNDIENRQMRAIEPTLNIFGKTRKRGRGVQILRKPLDKDRKDTISFSYETIQKFVSGRLTPNDLWALVMIKRITGNNTLNTGSGFKTSKANLGKLLNISEVGYKEIHRHLCREFNKLFFLEQVSYRTKEGDIASNVYLNISSSI